MNSAMWTILLKIGLALMELIFPWLKKRGKVSERDERAIEEAGRQIDRRATEPTDLSNAHDDASQDLKDKLSKKG